MKSLIMLSTTLSLCLLASLYGHAQEKNPSQQDKVVLAKEKIIQSEKEALKVEVENINSRRQNGSISEEEAENLKLEAAKKHALNIENRTAIIDNKSALEERNKEGELDDFEDEENEEGTLKVFGININKVKEEGSDRRTTSGLILAFGLNNVITEGESFNDSDFKIGGSRFFEIGWSWKTRVFENNNWLRVKYGVAFQFNGLKPKRNEYYVNTGEGTELQEFPYYLNKSKFRMDNLVVPIHFEFGPSDKIENEDYVKYRTYKKFRVGLGGYAGVNLGSRQKLKFVEDGNKVKQKLKSDYNTNNLIYGLSGYVGWGDTSLYVKYDLNTIFKDNPVDQRNISLGLRFDFD